MTSRCLQTPARPLAALALLLACAVPRSAGAAGAAPAGEAFSDSIQVSVVNLDVRVSDRQGKPVIGLRKEDFTVLEDGKPVEVSNFSAENGGTDAAASAPGAFGAPAAARGAADQRLRLAVFVDDVNLGVVNRARILESVRRFLHTELKPGDEVMIVRYDGELAVRQPFTSDLARLDASLAAILALPGDVRKFNASYSQAVEELAQAINSGEGFGPLAEAAVSNWAAQESSVVRGALNALDSEVSSLSGVPGRKSLLYVSDGLALVPGLELFTAISGAGEAAVAHRTSGMVAQRFDLTSRFRQITSHASRNRITFYPIESYGTRDGAISRSTTVRLENRQNGLRFLAEDTGGRGLLNATDVPAALARMSQDFSAYYSLGYQPRRAGDQAEHKIEVRVKSRDVADVRYRRWSRDPPLREAVAERTLAAMRFGAGENPLGASVEVVPGKKAGESLVRVTVPLARLYLEPRGDSRQGHLRFYVVASGGGRTSSVRETRPAIVNVPEAEAASGRMHDYTHEIVLSLPPGSYTLGLGVRDEKAAATSYLHQDFAVAENPGAAKR